MVRKDETSNDDNSTNSKRTTESSDSYSYLLWDVESPNNHVNEEWEAIERTLYQESGRHVTDPVLLKECKLWRETFPHIRVRGTAVKVEQDEDVAVQLTKSVQAIDKNHIALSKLNEKREKIKKTVVSQIVERLINKLNVNRESSIDSKRIIEMDGEEDAKPNVNTKSSGTQSEKESYFERGKKVDTKGKFSRVPAEEYEPSENDFDQTCDISDVFNDFEYNFSTDYLKNGNKAGLWSGYRNNEKFSREGREFSSNLAKNEEILRSGNITFKIGEKNSSTLAKWEKASDSLSNIIKPFEMTKKIDKKYESMLERILENKGFGSGGINAKKSAKAEISSYRESIENIHGKQNRGDFSCRKSKQLPKLNNFTNNWINRAEQHLHDPYGIIPKNLFPINHFDSTTNAKSFEKHSKFQSCRSASNAYQSEEMFLEELRREMGDYTASVRKEYEEEINLKRPQFNNKFNKNYTARTQKSSSCGDLPKKNSKSSNRTLKSCLEKGKSELTVRNGAKKKTGRNTGNQNVQLPPIETSIICTEIIGRPKIGSRTLPKKYI